MKKYGLRIGTTGVEFVSIAERDKALKDFTQGTDVAISNGGIKYLEGKGSFSVYDRDTKEIITTCAVCHGEFSIETCPEREYTYKYYGAKDFGNTTGYICDACFAKREKEKKLFDAQKTLDNANTTE